jgi:hypothetical protein
MTSSCSRAVPAIAAACLLACTTGEGDGYVRSDALFVEDCWSGPFDLQPSFFGANPYRQEELLIRVQRGDNLQEVSDGLTVLVSDVQGIRSCIDDAGGTDGSGAESGGCSVEVGLPPGVTPSGISMQPDPEPPQVSLALYLHATCHHQNGTIYAIDGAITFASLFSGNPNETVADDRLTDATFEDVLFADPRDMASDGTIDPSRTSRVDGHFRFFFQRGQPAQPFP